MFVLPQYDSKFASFVSPPTPCLHFLPSLLPVLQSAAVELTVPVSHCPQPCVFSRCFSGHRTSWAAWTRWLTQCPADTMGARCPVHVSLADMAADGLTAKQTLRLRQLLAATRLYSCAGSTADGQKAGLLLDPTQRLFGRREPSGG